MSPRDLLDIGPSRGNHYAAQVAPNDGSDFQVHSQAEIGSGYAEDPYFVATPDGAAVQFDARMDAPTTPGSRYPRSELREVRRMGRAWRSTRSWGPTGSAAERGSRTCRPNKPEVVIAQLHNGRADGVAIRTQLVSGATRPRVRINGSSVQPDLENPYVLGSEFGWMIEVRDGIGRIYYYARGEDPLLATPLVTGELETNDSPSWSFKAGAYLQSNPDTDDPAVYVSAELRDLHTEHLSEQLSSRADTTDGIFFGGAGMALLRLPLSRRG